MTTDFVPSVACAEERQATTVAYMMSRFPKITETFILYEILELEAAGVRVEVFPLLREPATVIHPEAERLMPRVRFQPFLSRPILRANLRAAFRQPLRYFGALAEVLWGTRGSLNFAFGALGIFPKSVRMAEQMEELGVTHLHAHFANHPTLAALIIHRLTGLPFSFTAHGSDIHIDQTMFGAKLKAARFGVTVCRYNVDFLADRVGPWVRDRLRVVRCGVDLDAFRPAPPSDEDRFAILCVGALREVKGHRHLIEACRLLAARGVGFECWLVGEGELQPVLEAQIRNAGLENRVRLLGPRTRPEVAELMRESSVVVLPSIIGRRGDREGVPVSLMEAMASGRPVVSSRQSGIPELVEDGESGILCRAGSPAALADALAKLAGDRALCRRMGEAGRRRIEGLYDLRRNARALAGMLTGTETRA
jgi:colanic acid/amylovoran biosynthesis glycosyltransferase